jgi:tyrosine-specific transport protein
MLSELDSRVFGSTMLIAGTSIGAAMLAMPILTGLFGFFGTIAILIAVWAFMHWTSLLILEATLRFKEGECFVTMARKVMGPFLRGLFSFYYFIL